MIIKYGDDNANEITVGQVVRCKDCKYYNFAEVNITPFSEWYKCRATGMYTPQNHYCSFGERREDVRKPD